MVSSFFFESLVSSLMSPVYLSNLASNCSWSRLICWTTGSSRAFSYLFSSATATWKPLANELRNDSLSHSSLAVQVSLLLQVQLALFLKFDHKNSGDQAWNHKDLFFIKIKNRCQVRVEPLFKGVTFGDYTNRPIKSKTNHKDQTH